VHTCNIDVYLFVLVPPMAVGVTPSYLITGQRVESITISWMVSACQLSVKLCIVSRNYVVTCM